VEKERRKQPTKGKPNEHFTPIRSRQPGDEDDDEGRVASRRASEEELSRRRWAEASRGCACPAEKGADDDTLPLPNREAQ
jgi:hypothetical protein